MMRSSLRFGRRLFGFLTLTILLVGPLLTRITPVVCARLLLFGQTKTESSSNANNNNNQDQSSSSLLVLPDNVLQLALLIGSLTLQIGDTTDRSPCKGGCSTDHFKVFEQGPSSWAVVTRTTSGHCLAVFSDSAGTVQDWLLENLNPRTSDYCNEENTGQCCQMRRGFARSYEFSGFQVELEKSLKACAASTCSNTDSKEDCVVLGGFSQGAATAAVAAMHLSGLDPTVIGLGAPPAIFPNCPLIDTEKWFQLINTLPRNDEGGLTYDMVPFLPGLGAVPLGHSFLLTDDTPGAVYLGMSTLGNILGPFDVNAHSLRSGESSSSNSGLLDHIESILKKQGNKMDSGGP